MVIPSGTHNSVPTRPIQARKIYADPSKPMKSLSPRVVVSLIIPKRSPPPGRNSSMIAKIAINPKMKMKKDSVARVHAIQKPENNGSNHQSAQVKTSSFGALTFPHPCAKTAVGRMIPKSRR